LLARDASIPLSRAAFRWAIALPSKAGTAISASIITWGIAFPWLCRKLGAKRGIGDWTALAFVALFSSFASVSGYGARPSLAAFVPAFVSAMVVGWLTRRRSLEDGIAAQLAMNVTGVLLSAVFAA